ncbi:unnamed protein product, partial [Meganyctiphanes norvegica]
TSLCIGICCLNNGDALLAIISSSEELESSLLLLLLLLDSVVLVLDSLPLVDSLYPDELGGEDSGSEITSSLFSLIFSIDVRDTGNDEISTSAVSDDTLTP